jgi:Protein of unknown function (DUF4013)
MDYAEILGDAYAFTKEGVLGNTNRWMKLILAVLCLGFPFNGYTMRIYRGKKPAPEVDAWGELFIDGLKMLAVGLVYIIPLMITGIIIFLAMILAIAGSSGDEPGMAASALSSLFMIVFDIVEIIVAVFLPVAYIRLARTGVFSEAFNFSAMKETIGKIGWINYVVAVVLVGLVIGVPVCILIFAFIFIFLAAVLLFANNPVVIIGLLAVMVIILLVVLPLIGVFHARYLTRVYDSAETPA